MPYWTWIIVAVVAGLAVSGVLLAVISRGLKARARAAETALRAEVNEPILRLFNGANYFGRQSKGKAQLRGNGVLALTDRAIHFRMWVSSNHLVVKRAAIKKVGEAPSHLGKRVFSPLLKVEFASEEGRENDAAAWWLPKAELAAWLAALA